MKQGDKKKGVETRGGRLHDAAGLCNEIVGMYFAATLISLQCLKIELPFGGRIGPTD